MDRAERPADPAAEPLAEPLAEPRSAAPALAASGPFMRLVRRSLGEQKGAMLLAALGLAGIVATELLAPWPLKLVFDHLLLGQPLPPNLAWLAPLMAQPAWLALAVLTASIAGVALANGLCSYLQLYFSAQIGHRITWQLRSALFAHLQRLSLTYHRSGRVGELITKVAGDTQLLRDLFADWALMLLRQLLTIAAMLAVMFWLNWPLALVAGLTLPPLLAVIFVLNRRVKASVRAQRRDEGRIASRLSEVLQAMPVVQAFGREQHESDRFRQAIDEHYQSGMRSTRATGATVRAIAVVTAIGTAITVLVGALQVLDGQLTPGGLLVFVAYVNSLFKPVRDLGRLAGKFSRAAVSAERVAEILAIEPDIEDAPDAMELKNPAGEIVLKDVHFAWRSGQPVLTGANLHIRPGERVALIGPSGAGKSTLLALLLRLAEPQSGMVRIDGLDIRRYRRTSLRQAFGIVLQDTLLFAATVRENIAYGQPDASQEAVESAAQAARAHEFIVDLPEGYDTVLGERGGTLSGGQRQRLCLARALVKRPAILVMDEPTAAIDPASARLIHEAVARQHRDRTLLVITHDTADLARYDRVLRLEGGQIHEVDRQSLPPAASPGPGLALVGGRRA